tara:strand:+ start:1981 stop:2175 length:195 start_codon:yes stop_codon:yes gene_type:complete
MSDSVKKYYEMVEDGIIKDKTLDSRPNINNYIVSEGHKTQAYNILVEYPEEAILEAARILKSGK